MLSPNELEYWEAHGIIEIAKIENIDWIDMDLGETIDEILRINAKRKAELKALERKSR